MLCIDLHNDHTTSYTTNGGLSEALTQVHFLVVDVPHAYQYLRIYAFQGNNIASGKVGDSYLKDLAEVELYLALSLRQYAYFSQVSSMSMNM
jgi:hypothetical protein